MTPNQLCLERVSLLIVHPNAVSRSVNKNALHVFRSVEFTVAHSVSRPCKAMQHRLPRAMTRTRAGEPATTRHRQKRPLYTRSACGKGCARSTGERASVSVVIS